MINMNTALLEWSRYGSTPSIDPGQQGWQKRDLMMFKIDCWNEFVYWCCCRVWFSHGNGWNVGNEVDISIGPAVSFSRVVESPKNEYSHVISYGLSKVRWFVKGRPVFYRYWNIKSCRPCNTAYVFVWYITDSRMTAAVAVDWPNTDTCVCNSCTAIHSNRVHVLGGHHAIPRTRDWPIPRTMDCKQRTSCIQREGGLRECGEWADG